MMRVDLQEYIRSVIKEAFVPQWSMFDVENTIRKIAKFQGIDESQLSHFWSPISQASKMIGKPIAVDNLGAGGESLETAEPSGISISVIDGKLLGRPIKVKYGMMDGWSHGRDETMVSDWDDLLRRLERDDVVATFTTLPPGKLLSIGEHVRGLKNAIDLKKMSKVEYS